MNSNTQKDKIVAFGIRQGFAVDFILGELEAVEGKGTLAENWRALLRRAGVKNADQWKRGYDYMTQIAETAERMLDEIRQ